uniref:Putative secreted protein n=1 Tax=Ixodes ricinus TaxID=34613 RepID=A0A0K8RDM7_IXORI
MRLHQRLAEKDSSAAGANRSALVRKPSQPREGAVYWKLPRSSLSAPTSAKETHRRVALRTAVFIVGTLSLVAILLSAIMLVKRKALHERFLRRKGRNGSVYYVKAHTNPVEDYNQNA